MGQKPVKSADGRGGAARSATRGGKTVGRLMGQKFFAARADATGEVAWPFESRPFTAMVELRREVGTQTLTRLAERLFTHGCRSAICRGPGAERCRDVFDKVLDNPKYNGPGGQSPWSMASDEEFEETLTYFSLPTGQAEIGLLVVVGDDADFRQAAGGFGRIIGRAGEWLSEIEPEDARIRKTAVLA